MCCVARALTGGEFLYQGQGGHVNTAISLAARYRCPDFVACASLAMHQIGLSYYAPIDAKTKVATELDINLVQGDATATFGYAVQMRTASVKAQFDTKGQVACGIEQELLGPAFVLMLNGELAPAPRPLPTPPLLAACPQPAIIEPAVGPR